MMTANQWVALGAFLGFLAVAFGAFGAHGLAQRLDARSLEIFRTGAQYQMYHALALILVGLWAAKNDANITLSGWAFTIGTILFSGSLYALAFTGVRALGAIAPLGGLSFLLGWLSFAWGAYRG